MICRWMKRLPMALSRILPMVALLGLLLTLLLLYCRRLQNLHLRQSLRLQTILYQLLPRQEAVSSGRLHFLSGKRQSPQFLQCRTSSQS